MNELNKKAFGGLLSLTTCLALLLFMPAWTINYWQAWVFLSVFSISVLMITVYLMKNDPKLLERRVNAGPTAEKERKQKIVQTLASAAFITLFVLSAIDHRLGWSVLPSYIAIAGDVFVAYGLFIVFLVFRENTFTSATIEVSDEQKVIATGPYALVRHPMYTGALVMLSGVPPALGSYRGLFAVLPMVIVIVYRLLDEEKFLAKNLQGYPEYQKQVKYRLLPFIW